MSTETEPKPEQFKEDELQQGEPRSIARQEALKHIKKQHPQRDVPRVDGEEREPNK